MILRIKVEKMATLPISNVIPHPHFPSAFKKYWIIILLFFSFPITLKSIQVSIQIILELQVGMNPVFLAR